MNLLDRFSMDTILEAALIVIAAYLAIKVFQPILTVVFAVAVGAALYIGIRNRDLLKAKLKELKSDIYGKF